MEEIVFLAVINFKLSSRPPRPPFTTVKRWQWKRGAWRAVAAPFGTQGSSNEAGFADGLVIVKITEVLCGACGHGDLVFKQSSPWPQR